MRLFLIFSLLFANALGQSAAGKVCVSNSINDVRNSCTLFAELQQCKSDLANMEKYTSGPVRLIVKQQSQIMTFLGKTDGTSVFDDLMNKTNTWLNTQGATYEFTWTPKELPGTVDVVADDEGLFNAFMLEKDLNSRLVLEARLVTSMPSTPPTPMPTEVPTTVQQKSEVLLFEMSSATPSTYSNIYAYWWQAGDTVTSGDGKRAAYDTVKISEIRFEMAGGASATYDLQTCDTMLNIMSTFGLSPSSNNDNTGSWPAGHGSFPLLSTTDIAFFQTQAVTIGQGDGSVDSKDWAVFGFDNSPGSDWNGDAAIGCENFNNICGPSCTSSSCQAAYDGAKIFGKPCGVDVLLFEISSGAPSTYSNSYAYWWQAGDTVSSGDGKRAAYDQTAISELKFVMAGGGEAVYDLQQCDTLLNIMSALGLSPSSNNDNTGSWPTGHAVFPLLSTTDSAFFQTQTVTIGQGDGSNDSKDWAVFGFDAPQADWNGDSSIGCETGNSICGPGCGFSGTCAAAYDGAMIYGKTCSGYTAPTAAPTSVPTAAPVYGAGTNVLLFEITPTASPTSQFSNSYAYWWQAGGVVSSGDGKRSAYDTQNVQEITFKMSTGGEATYNLGQCDTMANIMGAFGLSPSSNNDNTGSWPAGHGSFPLVSTTDAAYFQTQAVTIGQGDGSSDSKDWAVFGFDTSPGNDWNGDSAVGCESSWNICGGPSGVQIYGKTCHVPTKVLLFEIQSGAPATYSNSYAYWWQAGDTVASGEGKRSEYDVAPISKITFVMAGGAEATYDLQQCDTMVNIMSSFGLSPASNNDNTGSWPAGHGSFPMVGSTTDIAFFQTQVVTIGQGDGNSDSKDWAVFGFDTNPSGDWNGDSSIGCENYNNICGPSCTSSSCQAAYDGVMIYGTTCGGNVPAPTDGPTLSPTVAPTAFPTTSPTAAPVSGPGVDVLLFEITATTPATYSNSFAYWWQAGSTVSSGAGKRAAYDTQTVSELKFVMSTGAEARYNLGQCDTMVNIMSAFGLSPSSNNDNTGSWPAGHGSFPLISTTDTGYFQTQAVTIGQGDGSVDSKDWVVFGFDTNPANDWNGDAAIGCESSWNICGGPTSAMIYGKTCSVNTKVLLFEISSGAPSTFSNTYAYWWQAGDTVASGDGKRAAYDTTSISKINFVMAGGAEATYDLQQCDTMVNIMSAFGLSPSSNNDNTGSWPAGHGSFPLISTTDSAFFQTQVVTIGQGDGSSDSKDWVVFGFDTNPSNDWDADPSIGCENYNNICGPGCGYSGTCASAYDGAMIYGMPCGGVPTSTPTPGGGSDVLLFEITSTTPATYSNSFAYWWQAGGTVSSGDGKRAAYDTTKIQEIKFVMSTGGEAVYSLGQCDTMVNIMSAFGLSPSSNNDNTGSWPAGHGSFPLVSTTDTGYFQTQAVTIGQGDGSVDSKDWAVFGFDTSPSNDWNGDSAVGCESSWNICGGPTGVQIYGKTCGQAFTSLFVLSSAGINSSTYSNTYAYYWQAGDVVSSGDGKRQDYDTQKVDQLKIVLAGGGEAVYDLGTCATLQSIMASTGITSSSTNTNTGSWPNGHLSFPKVSTTDSAFFIDSAMTVARGDGNNDSTDWAVFAFSGIDVGGGGFNWGGSVIGCERNRGMCGPGCTQTSCPPAYDGVEVQGRTC